MFPAHSLHTSRDPTRVELAERALSLVFCAFVSPMCEHVLLCYWCTYNQNIAAKKYGKKENEHPRSSSSSGQEFPSNRPPRQPTTKKPATHIHIQCKGPVQIFALQSRCESRASSRKQACTHGHRRRGCCIAWEFISKYANETL